MMHGMGNSCSVEGSLRKPFAASPRLCAALTILLALLPSRETPQATRNCSSGIQLPCQASTIASAAAPHSTASICRMVGVRLTRPRAAPEPFGLRSGAGGGVPASAIKSGQLLEQRDHQVDRALLA